MPTLILASQSPRRREILTQAGIFHEVRVPGIEERHQPGESPAEYVRRLAREKAAAAVRDPAEFVLAADTVVVVDGSILEKPDSAEDAARMLGALSGRAHTVLTGVCLLHAGKSCCPLPPTAGEQYPFGPGTPAGLCVHAAAAALVQGTPPDFDADFSCPHCGARLSLRKQK